MTQKDKATAEELKVIQGDSEAAALAASQREAMLERQIAGLMEEVEALTRRALKTSGRSGRGMDPLEEIASLEEQLHQALKVGHSYSSTNNKAGVRSREVCWARAGVDTRLAGPRGQLS